MRTRRSNKTKRFIDYSLALDEEDEGRGPAEADNAEVSDQDFGPDADGATDVRPHEDDQSDAEEDDLGDSDDLSGVAGGDSTQFKASRARKPAKLIAPTQREVDYHQLPVYPLDPRLSTRAYAGPLRKGARYGVMRDLMFGPDYNKVKLIWGLLDRWARYPVLPARLPPQHKEGILPSPWLPASFEIGQEKAACKWFEEYWMQSTEVSRAHPVLAKHGERLIPQARGDLALLLGPVDSQKEYRISQGSGLCLSSSATPVEESGNPDEVPNGWVFDVGGIVLALGWAPVVTGNTQILALAVIPHSDQAKPSKEETASTSHLEKNGSLQFWEFVWDIDQEQRPKPARRPPRFLLAKLFDWGRPKRMAWCPVSFAGAGLCGLLAVLTGDGRVRVLDVKVMQDSGATEYEWIESPVATLGFTDNYNVEVTCFTWVGANRIALGHTDGSITLWSIYPAQMLQRHAIHTSNVLDISSGYPSLPNMVASMPVGGFTSLTDLSNPTSESTYVPLPGINFQPGVLDWSDHLQGWLALSPTGGQGLNTLVFLSVRYFPVPKSMLTSMSMPLCVSIRGNHPFGLVGCADGSVWSFNAITKLFKQREEDAFKLKILEHEFRPPEAFTGVMNTSTDEEGGGKLRGAARILQGFFPEINDDPRSERLRAINMKKMQATAKKKSGKKGNRAKPTEKPSAHQIRDDFGDEPAEEISSHMASRMVTHEPLTRVTATAWNPNLDYACWAAVAFGSGVVRVIDIGVE